MKARCAAMVMLALALPGCGAGDGEFAPLQPGRWWLYQGAAVIRGETHPLREWRRNLGGGVLQGRAVRVQRLQRSAADYLARGAGGVVRVASRRDGRVRLDPPGQLVVPAAGDHDAHWAWASYLALVESRTFAAEDRLRPRRIRLTMHYRVTATGRSVRTPAGTFKQCVELTGNGRTTVPVDRHNARAEVLVEERQWYAPGIGLVRRERAERSDSVFLDDGTLVLELIAWGH